MIDVKIDGPLFFKTRNINATPTCKAFTQYGS